MALRVPVVFVAASIMPHESRLVGSIVAICPLAAASCSRLTSRTSLPNW